MQHILVVEDEPDIARLIDLHLSDAGFDVDVEHTARGGLERARRNGHDLVILDLMLPDGDGLDICRALRASADYTPILILTARSTELDRVVGLEVGADDYLVKPFAVRELVARVKAILRRVELSTGVAQRSISRLEIEGLVIEPEKRGVTVNSKPVELTVTEFDLLVQLATNPGRVYTRAQLLDLVWGVASDSYEHTVNAHVNRLRAKIEPDPAHPFYVRTVWGVGYRFVDPTAREF